MSGDRLQKGLEACADDTPYEEPEGGWLVQWNGSERNINRGAPKVPLILSPFPVSAPVHKRRLCPPQNALDHFHGEASSSRRCNVFLFFFYLPIGLFVFL